MLTSIPVSHIAGVGRSKETSLAELGLTTVYDVLHHFPFRFEDRRIQPLEAFPDGGRVTVRATVQGNANVRWQGKKSVLTARLLVDQRHRLTGVWFNQPYLKQKLVDGRYVVLSGKYDATRHTIAIAMTEFDARVSDSVSSQWSPVYRSVRSISTAQIQKVVEQALVQYGDQLEEILPRNISTKYRLITHRAAVFAMHQPEDAESLRQAHRRLAFEEFFLFQLQLQWFRRTSTDVVVRVPKNVPERVLSSFQASLPFPLTDAQRLACTQFIEDFAASRPMHRLLQGDVGSGKTWVAFFAIYAMAEFGQQSALMAPTEILAEQHYAEACRRLEPLGVACTLLTGQTAPAERQRILHTIADGTVQLVIGTHALLTEHVIFSDLGLVVTDEQHRFGVSQRSVLRAKGRQPDVLFLSATPIPRTLALAVYGDLDVSVLNERPKGRQPIVTTHLSIRQEAAAIRKIRQELAKGHQAYVVAPLVEQSEQLDVLSATEVHERFQEPFAGYKIELLHGKLSAQEKDKTMRAFVSGDVDVLVSTTVIEVGIDVPNATVMCIYHAERFGLAQLHQLRGRVGRGAAESFCVLLSDPSNEVAKQRLACMLETEDGFDIAERDLSLRGPGEFLGVRQSGLPEFSVGDLTKDFKVMTVAREEAIQLVASTDFWLLPQFAALRGAIERVPGETHLKD